MTPTPPDAAAAGKEKLLYTRRSIKGRVTKLENFLDNVKDLDEFPRRIIINLETRLQQLRNLQIEFNEVQNKIDLLLTTDLEREEHGKERDDCNENICSAISEYMLFIEEHSETPRVLSSAEIDNGLHSRHSLQIIDNTENTNGQNRNMEPNVNANGGSRHTVLQRDDTNTQFRNAATYENARSESRHSHDGSFIDTNNYNRYDRQIVPDIKLPTIQLPRFDGAYDKWLEFHDIYGALIHNNTNLSDIQKFYYLKSALSGDAVDIIQSVSVSSANYLIAWQLLTERFKNLDLIVNNYVKELFELPTLGRESLSGLRHLTDSTMKNIRCLEALNQPVYHWDTLIVYIVTSKLDHCTKREWQQERSKQSHLATFDQLKVFLARKCTVLEGLQDAKSKQLQSRNTGNSYNKPQATFLSVDTICLYCKQTNHPLYICNTFKRLPIQQRIAEVKRQRLCYNCLANTHQTRNCKSINCRKCNGVHHTILHFDNANMNYNTNSNTNSNTNTNTDRKQVGNPQFNQQFQSHISNAAGPSDGALPPNTSSNNVVTTTNNSKQPTIANHSSSTYSTEVLLSTAIIDVKTADGNYVSCRVLLDPGSQSNFLTFNTCKQLKLSKQKSSTSLNGINKSSSNSKYKTTIEIKSKHTNYKANISCLLLPQITEELPLSPFNKSSLTIPNNIKLADPQFNESSNIDILIGAELYLSLLCIGQIKLNDSGLTLQKTKLGWIVGGKLEPDNVTNNSYESVSCISTLERLVHKFWEIENLPSEKTLNPEEILCELDFKTNTYRDNNGRFVVKIPFKTNITNLGNSRSHAIQRFYALERKLKNNPDLKKSYKEFIHEYIDLNHMSKCNESLTSNELTYYLPHHPVLKESSLTTKMRVVFDASCLTDKGNSLNSFQHTGATVQSHIYSILLRFRQHNYVMVADVEKMYRQILIHENHRRFQRIFWRDEDTLPLECYELNTVTYGTTSAPFLATRCLYELAEQIKTDYPAEAEIIQRDFYVDDLVTGADTIEKLCLLKTNITNILDGAKLPLRKWLSNDSQVTNQGKNETKLFNLTDDFASKTLGILWDARADTLQCVQLPLDSNTNLITKRNILSLSSQLFDPLGLFSPAILMAKLIVQSLWQLNLSWDESVPQDIEYKWRKYRSELNSLTDIKIPRLISEINYDFIELHGFADASTLAYGACVYVRSVNRNTNYITTRLLTSKSKVAPLQQLTLPRLELCAAVLLSNLMDQVISSLRLNFKDIYYWSDSTITLCWINSNSNRWKTFVSNRVAQIQNLSKLNQWHHVKSGDNPADLISRGVWPQDLGSLDLWWLGPEWLRQDKLKWPVSKFTQCADETELKTVTLLVKTSESVELLSRFSNFSKLNRVVAYCLRFSFNCKRSNLTKISGPLTTAELHTALIFIIKLVQAETFVDEINQLTSEKTLTLKRKSLLTKLSVFLDRDGVLRVGGRLENADFKFDKKHPMLLPRKHYITRLIAEQEHKRLLHCGPQTLLYSLHNKFWPLGGRTLTREIVHNCVRCFRVSPRAITYPMGDLPSKRITPSAPFTNCGVDYAGPLNIRDRKGRGSKTLKVYICIFVCFATKATHLELVTSLTTEAFIATFRRFAARRGKPNDMYSDNATNFVGADAELEKLATFFKDENTSIQSSLAHVGVNWHFIPPRSPNFGGLWEAAVKSAKHHLKRVLGESLLTYEDLQTIVVQIESVLNSRPLTQLNSDPHDLQPLTPAHFLIGRSLTTLADPSYFHVPSNRLGAYQQQQHLLQSFWRRWNKEYISSLQLKPKSKGTGASMDLGDVVVMKDDNLPPLRWKIGRIIELHPGKDGIARVATVKFSDMTTLKRATTKLCPLPKNE